MRLDLVELTGASVDGAIVRVERTPDPSAGGDDRAVLSLGEVQVVEGVSGFASLIATDIEDAMHGVNATAYLRFPFQGVGLGSLESLRLRMRYDDGFVAYLNGEEVARRNAPGSAGVPPAWNATSTSERLDSDAVVFEEIDITAYLDALVPGDNVLAVHGLNRSRDDGDFLVAVELLGLDAVSQALRYFENPTPGGPNDSSGIVDFVADTRFSVDRGVHSAPFDVELSTDTDGAEIRYTLNRQAPTSTTGTVYTGPIRIDSTTVLRAAAFRPGFRETNVDTQTYIFLDDVVTQPSMLQDIVQSPTYGPLLPEALTTIPTVSLVTTSSINPTSEVPTSFEFFLPDGSQGVQVDCGIKKVGGHSLGAYPKNNMRLYFRKTYGPGKLRHPLFGGLKYGDRTVDEFDRLNLRSGSHDSVFYLGNNQQSPSNAQYLRNRWVNDVQFEMGHLSLNGRFVQVYVNGVYQGHHQLFEHPTRDYLATYMGGAEADYDSLNSGSRPVGSSSTATWNRIVGLTGNYTEFQRYVDVENYVDYMVLNFYAGNDWDWRPGQNWMAGGPSSPDSGGYKFFGWDSDIIFRRLNDHNLNRGGPGGIFPSLIGHDEFRTLFADRVFKHMFGKGVLTPERTDALYTARAEEIRTSIVAETARWRWGGTVWTRDNQWQSELSRLRTQFFPQRPEILLDQLRTAGWYPFVEPPSYRLNGLPHLGGRVEAGDVLTMHFEGSSAQPQIALLDSESPASALVPRDDALGDAWWLSSYVEGSSGETWISGENGVGYDTGGGYDAHIDIDVEGDMRGASGNSSVYIRLPFTVADQETLDGFEGLELLMLYDDGFVAYINGIEVMRAGAPAQVDWDSSALTGTEANLANPSRFVISEFLGELVVGDNLLAIHGLNSGTTSSDMLIVASLNAEISEDNPPPPSDNVFFTVDGSDPMDAGAERYTGPLSLTDTVTIKGRSLDAGEWSALHEAFFHFDIPLRITEIMYHPRDPDVGSSFGDDAFEFLEFQNTDGQAIDLTGFQLSGGVDYDFSSGVTDLPAGGVLVVVRDLEAFLERYPFTGATIAGEYSRNLSNAGDTIRLEGPAGEPLLDFRYSDAWYPLTDGQGHSLEIVDAEAEPNTWGESTSWQPSDEVHGSPGLVEGAAPGGFQRPGNINQDLALDISDGVRLLGLLFLSGGTLPCGGDSINEGGNLLLADVNGDGSVDLTDAVGVLNYLFLNGSAPALGVECVRIAGCPNACD